MTKFEMAILLLALIFLVIVAMRGFFTKEDEE